MSGAPRRTRLPSLLVRSSAVLPLAPGIAAILVANTALRGHPWDHEWGWAIYQAGFVTVFLGPLCAGIGVWDGTELAKAAPAIESSGRPGLARGAAWGAIVAVVAAVYLVLLLVLGVVLAVGGILDGPGLVDLTPIPGVLAQCGAWAAVGVAIGYRWRTPLLAPIVAAGSFGLTLVLFMAQPLLIQVGGATSSILFLMPRPAIQIAQVVSFAAISVAALIGFPARHEVSRPGGHRLGRAIAPVVALAAISFLLTRSGTEWNERTRTMVCEGEQPRICVAAPYRDRIGWPRPYLTPYLEAVDDLQVPAPTTFSQAPDRPLGQGSIPDELLRGHPAVAGPLHSIGPGGAAVLGAFLPDFCDTYSDPAMSHAYNAVNWWLTSITDPAVIDDPSVPTALTSGDRDVKAAYLRAALGKLTTCSR